MSLKNVKVLEFAGLAPGPFCGMILADLGASIIRIDKLDSFIDIDYVSNGKKSIALNLKEIQGIEIIRKLVRKSDVLIEPFRSGVMEKLGLSPHVLLSDNPRLIYARLTGFGQNGPYAKKAGHDINFLAMSGLLSRMKWWPNQPPNPPLNLISDFSGGSLMCAFGIVAALYERDTSTQRGQVIDCSMTHGSSYLASWILNSMESPLLWPNASQPGKNLLDGGRHFYNVYETKDGKFMAVGAFEPQFYQNLLEALQLDSNQLFSEQFDQETDAEKGAKIKAKFLEKNQSEWCTIFDKTDACVTPVLSLKEAQMHEHNAENFYTNGTPKPAPKYSKTTNEPNTLKAAPKVGEHTHEILHDLGYSFNEIEELKKHNIILNNTSKL